MSRRLRWVACALVAAACGSEDTTAPRSAGPADAREPFVDATAGSGVGFTHDNAASDARLLPETMGSGVAVFDYDGDGHPDLFFVSGSPDSPAALYRNLGGWAFEDVTTRANAGVRLRGMGVATGDVDGDGTPDLFVSGVGGDVLLRNRGDGTFEDASALLSDLAPGFGSSAAFLDADGDGWLDLYVGRYVQWTPEEDVACVPDGVHRSYCTPEVYPGASNRLLRNRGAGAGFEDVTVAAGLDAPEGKALGIVPLDHDGDGWPDIAVANDTERDYLFVNRGDGTFDERGVETGMAFSQSGAPRGGMGIDAGDLSGAARSDLVVGNFAQEMSAVFRARDGGLYSDDAAQLGIGLPSLLTLAFGTLIVDVDLDGWNDVVLANGHIEPEIEALRPNQTYAQPTQVFRRLPSRESFELVEAPALAMPRVSRGLAAGDLDGDGDVDLVVSQNGRSAVLLEGAGGGSWLAIAPRSGRGAAVYGTRAVLVAEGRRRSATLTSGRSYLSASEPALLFGLGEADGPEEVEVQWPGGARLRLQRPVPNRVYVLPPPAAAG